MKIIQYYSRKIESHLLNKKPKILSPKFFRASFFFKLSSEEEKLGDQEKIYLKIFDRLHFPRKMKRGYNLKIKYWVLIKKKYRRYCRFRSFFIISPKVVFNAIDRKYNKNI